MTKDERLTERTIKIIQKGGNILLKQRSKPNYVPDYYDNLAPPNSEWYIHQWTNIASGPDGVRLGKRATALEIFDLKWAFALAKLYDCKVVVYYPERAKCQPKNV
jgi:hypothetical protein